jgi:hypothetical protein
MNRVQTILAASIAVVTTLGLCVSPSAAQSPPPDLLNSQIEIEYVPPKTDALVPAYEHVKARGALETLRQFFAPLQLPADRVLAVKFDECGRTYVRHAHNGPAIVCYEFVRDVERAAPTGPIRLAQIRSSRGVVADAGRVGPVVQALIRETTIAAIDLLQIPVWGRIDDAADRLTAAIMLQFSKYDLAYNSIVGTAWFLASDALSPEDLSDVRGTTLQRYYTMLCIAYGGNRQLFGDFIPNGREVLAGDLPLQRARSCESEYQAVTSAFYQEVTPHIDGKLLEKVRNVKWINFND